MPSPRKDGKKSPLPFPVSEGQERHGRSGTLGTPSTSSNNTSPSHRVGEGETLSVTDTHQDVDHMGHTPNISNLAGAANDQVHPRTTRSEKELATHDDTAEARPTCQESLPSGPTGLERDGSQPFPHSNNGGPGPTPSAEYGPRVEVLVLGPDPRLAENAASERPPAVVDSEKKAVTLRGPGASRSTSRPQQRRADDPQSNEAERRYKEPPSNTNYRQRSLPRTTDHRRRYSPHRRASSPNRPARPPYHRAPSPRGRDQYRPSSRQDSHYRLERSRGLGHGDDDWRPGNHNGGRSGQESRPPNRAHTRSFREDTVSRGISRRRSLSPTRSPPNWDRYPRASHRLSPYYSPPREPRSRRSCSPKRSRDISRRSPRQGAPDPRKPSGGDSQEESAPRRHDRGGSEGGRATSSAHDGSMGYQPGPKDSTQGDHISTNAYKTTNRGSIEGSSGDGKIGDKPRAPIGLDFGPTAETFGANPPTLAATPPPKGAPPKPTKSTPTAPGTNISPSANTKRTSTIAPETTMGNLKPFANKPPGGPPGGPTPLSDTLPDPIPQKPTAPSKAASPSLAQEIPKPAPHPNITPEFDAEYLADREAAKKLLGVSEKEFDAEMARRTADFNANIARRKALGHPIHGSQVSHPGGQNLPGGNSKISESSRDANQMDTVHDDFTSRLKVSAHVGPGHAAPPSPEGPTPQAHEPKEDMKGRSKKKAEVSDPDNDFSKENLWPGADSLDRPGSFTPSSPRWQSGSASFVAGAPEYYIPRGFFGSSPEPFIPASPPTFGSNQPIRKPKYVDHASSPDPTINCTACGPPLTISLTGSQAALYNVHLKDSDDLSHLLFTNAPKNYYLLHVLTFPSHKSRLIYSDKIMTLRDFTKIIRLGFDLHRPISQITVYLYGRDSDGCPLEWKPIHIMSVTDWDGSMSVGRQWSCQISVVVEFVEPDVDPAASAAAGRGPKSGEGGAGPSK